MITPLFSTPLGKYEIEENLIKETRENILRYLSDSCKDPEGFFSGVSQNYQFKIAENFCKSDNYLTYQTYDDLKLFESFKPLVDRILWDVEWYFDETCIEAEAVEITSMWANIYKPGGDNNEHHHPNSFLSGVVVIDDDIGDCLRFYDPRHANYVMIPSGGSPFWERCYDEKYPPGTHIIFPSWLQHRPFQYTGKNPYRITIAYNLMLRGDTGEWGYHIKY